MLEEAVPRNGPAERAGSLAASVLFHALVAFAIVQMWVAPPPVAPLEESIPVTMLTPDEVAALTAPAAPPAAPETPPPTPPQTAKLEPPAAKPPEAASSLMHAATILSGLALAEPRNRRAREALPKLNPTERMIQLCNIEALQQVARVRHDFTPEIVSAYAMKALAIGRDTVEAEGAALRSGDDWYALRYRCRLAPGHGSVVAFDFLASDRLPPERVEELGLAVGK